MCAFPWLANLLSVTKTWFGFLLSISKLCLARRDENDCWKQNIYRQRCIYLSGPIISFTPTYISQSTQQLTACLMIGPNKYTRAHMGLSAIWKYSSTLLKNAQVRNNNAMVAYFIKILWPNKYVHII
jgi:hypothetical protein